MNTNKLRSFTGTVTRDQGESGAPGTVLFINRVYPPSPGATGEMLRDLAEDLVRRGWAVTIVTQSYKDEPRESVTPRGVAVQRVRGLMPESRSLLGRLICFLTLYPALLLRTLMLARHDVVVTKTDPPLQVVLGPFIRLFKRSYLVHWVQDVYPEIAEELGVIKKGGIIGRLVLFISNQSIRTYDHVVVIGRCMQSRMFERGIDREKLSIVSNWPTSHVVPLSHASNEFRKEHELEGKFVVMYSGNMGLAHPFEAVLEAAENFLVGTPDMRFVFVGHGARLEWLKQQVGSRCLTNVQFIPFQPKGRLAEVLSAADVHLVTMEDSALGLVVPSKVYGAMASGRPCIFVGPDQSEAAQMILENRCGTVITRPDSGELTDAILSWYARNEERRLAGLRAHLAVHTRRKESSEVFDTILRSVKEASSNGAAYPYPNGLNGVPVEAKVTVTSDTEI